MENNKLIAEFMGAKLLQDNKVPFIYAEPKKPHHDRSFHDGTNGRKLENLEYHTSWDWLMPVVQKLKTTRKNPEHTFLTVAFGKLNQSLMEAKIEPVYRDVVNIIKLLTNITP